MARGESQGVAGKIVGMAIGAIMLSTVGMTAIQQLFAANTTGIDATVVTLVQTVVAIVIGIGFMVLFLKQGGIKV